MQIGILLFIALHGLIALSGRAKESQITTAPPDLCIGKTCSYHGTCTNNRCSCDVGYGGTNCEQDLIKIWPNDATIEVQENSQLNIIIHVVTNVALTIRVYRDRSWIRKKENVNSGTVQFHFGQASKASAGEYKFYAYPVNSGPSRTTATVEVVFKVPVTTPEVNPSVIYVPVTTGGPKTVTCTADGDPTPTTAWYKGSDYVQYYPSNEVYQSIDGKLNIQYALKTDAGVYTCKAWNTINHKRVTKTVTATLKVLGQPKILKVKLGYCQTNQSVTVKWQLDVDSLSIKHKIHVAKQNGYEVTKEVTPTKLQQEITIGDLQRETRYYILIEVCPDSCIYKLQAKSSYFKTSGGLPSAVSQVRTQSANKPQKKQCRVTWTSSISSEENPSYEIEASSSLVYQPLNWNRNFSEKLNSTQTIFYFPTEPNRNYQFRVRPRTCSGFGPQTVASGDCTTDAEAPEHVPQPTTICDINCIGSIINIEVKLPDEINGRISCVFLIVHLVNGSNYTQTSQPTLTRSELREIAKTNQFPESTRYISLALSRKNITGSIVDVVLGDDRATFCDITDGIQSRKKRATFDTIYEGRNWPMKQGYNYSISVVTSTPSTGGEVYFRSSEPYTFVNIATAETEDSNFAWIVAVIVGVLLLIIAGVIFILNRRLDTSLMRFLNLIQRITYTRNKPQERNNSRPLQAIPSPQADDPNDDTIEQPYANFKSDETQSDTKILLPHLLTTFKDLKENDSRKFTEQFENIENIEEGNKPAGVEISAVVKKKNRYKNILPYERTAVTLTGEKAEDKYINASYINGYQQPRKFIATQGPLPQTVKDFWRMVVEQNCKVIVMLTKCVEGAKRKCEKYWPDRGESIEHQQIKVTNIEEANYGGYTRRKLKIEAIASQDTWKVQHYQFLKWPDHGVPLSTSCFFRMHKEVMKSQNIGSTRPPIIVHCSAGCGRTGTFIGYNILLEEIQSMNYIDVFGCVVNMRVQRTQMVQNSGQYKLLHKLLLEAFQFEDSDTEATEFPYNIEIWNRTDSIRIRKEFDNLSILDLLQRSKGNAEQFAEMNRNQSIVPYDDTRLVIICQREDVGNVYINASTIEVCFNEWVQSTLDLQLFSNYFQSYDYAYRLIAAQGPLDNTVEYFWRAILDNNVNTIVMLTKLREDDQEQCSQYWPGSVGAKDKIGNTKITLVAEETNGQIIKRNLSIERGSNHKNIVQYQYVDWTSTICPQDTTDVLNLITNMQSNLRQEKNSAVLIHCSDGAGRTGAFCAIVNLIERVKAENRVDVFRAVKDLRDYRPGMVQTLDQYLFCYRCVLSYLQSFSEYANYHGNKNPLYQNM